MDKQDLFAGSYRTHGGGYYTSFVGYSFHYYGFG